MISWKVQERAYRSLFLMFLLALASLAPHILRPTASTPLYASLTVVLIFVNLLALRWFDRAPCVAFQLYWYTALVVIGAMTFADVQKGAVGETVPFIVALPPLATLAFRWSISWRAAVPYGLGALALVIPSGFAYRELGVSALIAFVFLAVTVGRKSGDDLQTLSRVLRDGTKRLNDANTKAKRQQ